jgi:hypothetical protein
MLYGYLRIKPFLTVLTKHIDHLIFTSFNFYLKVNYKFVMVTNNELPATFIAKHIACAFNLGFQ